jgi:hypothetical protein
LNPLTASDRRRRDHRDVASFTWLRTTTRHRRLLDQEPFDLAHQSDFVGPSPQSPQGSCLPGLRFA